MYCIWAAKDPPDPVEIRHICEASTASPAPMAEYPPLATQSKTLARDLWAWVVAGFAMSTQKEQARRLSICATCQHWDAGRCRLCGCNLMAKVVLKTAHCPLDPPKW